MFSFKKKAKPERDPLDGVVVRWTDRDFFRKRDLLRSLCVQGASGSGKSSAVALQVAKACLKDRQIVLHILASKPEDREWWMERFVEAGRANELRIFGPDSDLRYNVLDAEVKAGADDREIASVIMTCAETLRRGEVGAGSDGENGQFFRVQTELMIEMAVVPMRLATATVQVADLQRFVSGAAASVEQLSSPEWREGFHSKVLAAAFEAPKNEIERADFEVCLDYWLNRIPRLNDRTRTSIETQVQQVFHVMGTGIVRKLLSTDTNVSPAIVEDGTSVLVDMPGSRYGASGQFVNAVWHLAVQRHVLRRHAKPGDRIIVQWIDEFQNHVFSGDSRYLAECRSHLGCQVVLTQSMHAFYAAMKGGSAGEHLADALLTNYGVKCFCAVGDAKTAEYASSLVGKHRQTLMNGSMSPDEDVYDAILGRSRFTGGFSESVQNILEAREFMTGLRTGGAANGNIVDAIIVRSGESFSNGQNFLRVAFSQR